MNVTGQNVLIVGMARSGCAAAKLLLSRGARVTINDSKPREELDEHLKELDGLQLEWKLGTPAMECLEGKQLLVLSPGIPDNVPFVKRAREMGIKVLAEIEVASLLSEGDLVAVTGTNGKTTTVTLLSEIFRHAGRRSFAVGNIGYPYSEAALLSQPGDMMVCECSSFQMETIEQFHPRAAALLNITEDHLNRHGTMAEYTRLKMRIFENQTSEDFAVFNADAPELKSLTEQVKSRVLLFSHQREVENGAFVRDGRLVFRLDGCEQDICDPREIYIPGPHNLENAMAAVCMASVMGVAPQVIAKTLRGFRGVEHRIEFTRELAGVRYYNDSKGTNVASTLCAVRAMNRPTVIILGGSDKHSDFTPLAELMVESAEMREAVLIGATADQIEHTLRRCGFQAIHRAGSMQEAVYRAQELAQVGWNVLLSPACASFDMFHDYEERGRVFKRLVLELK